MKLYFYYGVMGSSKTANALMKKFNLEEHGKKVVMIKPSIDNRDGTSDKGKTIVKSRIGISCEAIGIDVNESIIQAIDRSHIIPDCIIVDEAQFLTKDQVNELRDMVSDKLFVICYGLRTDFQGNLFEGSKRLLEVSDSVREIESLCNCGSKAIINARYKDGKIIYNGDKIEIGGNDKYISLCYRCWKDGKLK